jgi:simple sugar transport system permease protein
MDWGAVFGAAAIIPLLNASIRLAIPTGLAAVGESLCQRAGVLNLSLEGMMLSGAYAAFLGVHYSGQQWLGVATGIGGGLLIGVLMATFSITLKTEQVINGIALVLLAQGLTGFIHVQLFGVTSPERFDPLAPLEVPLLGAIPGVGSVVFDQSPLVYVAVVLIVGIWWVLNRTRFGLAVRAAGDRPAAADAAGLNVDHVRWMAILVSGAMAGLGGAVLVVGQLGLFVQNVTAGRGWVAIALVIFGRWNPLRVAAGALLFGFTDALQLRIQAASGGIESNVPFELFQALPYLVTIIVVIVATARSRDDAQPEALGVPYIKGVN